MSQPYPLTPPLGWVLDLLSEARKRAKSEGLCGPVDYVYMVNKSAQMGWDQRGEANEAELQQRADQELEACCEWVRGWYGSGCGELINGLRAARRPKPPSLKEQALARLTSLEELAESMGHSPDDTIRRALEALPND